MKHILQDNALESWTMAIKYSNFILNGKATLQYRKQFVSSLHNAVELFIKQLMLDNNDHRVCSVRKGCDADGHPAVEFCLLPYWEKPWGEFERFKVGETSLQIFSYKKAVQQSKFYQDLKECISEEVYGYNNIGFIQDRGYFSKENLKFMDDNGFAFVIMAPW